MKDTPLKHQNREKLSSNYKTKGDDISIQFYNSTSTVSAGAVVVDDVDGGGVNQINNSMRAIDLWKEAVILANIAIPTVMVQFSLYFIFPQGASVVGRFEGSHDLAAFSLGSLTGNILCLSIIVGIVSAADTLMPRAYGMGQYRQVKIITIRTFLAACIVLFIPTFLFFTFPRCIEWAFLSLGQDPTVSALAASWVQVYALGVPFVLTFRLLQRFLSCQHIVWPLVFGAAVGCFLVLPFLLKWFVASTTTTSGFVGSATAIVIAQIVQFLLVLLYLKLRPVYHPETWQNGPNMNDIIEAIQLEPILEFFRLSLGGVLSMTEWWFWEALCFLVGYLGVIPLCIHTVAYNVIPLSYMIPLGFSVGLSVRIGHLLGQGEVQKAKTLTMVCFVFVVSLGIIWAIIVWLQREFILALFTNDEDVLEGCRRIWPKVCIHLVLLFIYCFNGGLLRALGKQLEMAAVIIVVLWIFGMPLLWYVGKTRGGGIDAIWTYYLVLYAIMDVGLIATSLATDWQAISDRIVRQKYTTSATTTTSDMDDYASMKKTSERTGLLPLKN